ncbi:MAG TPA: ankyrin repeat domain-containing protein [Bacteroidales bacterium]|nr:ankyrin repeat domain-containing protein [Bacteroidales bacterium]HOR60547.1 ankyrin repeat domain-containing protein [Bacteroidales bacterium]HPL04329.1 ankyrin repeat domain-containing protein [Bacteroidales bacterium]
MKRIVIVSIVMCFISSLYSQEICLTAFEKEVIELFNQKRTDAGLKIVNISPVLMFTANKNAEEIYIQTFINHEPQEFGNYNYKHEQIQLTTSVSKPSEIIKLLTATELNTNYDKIVLQKGEYSSNNWESIGICIRDTIAVIIMGEKPETAKTYDICNNSFFFNNGEVQSNPIICVKVSETAQLSVYSIKRDGSSTLYDCVFVKEDGIEWELENKEAVSFRIVLYPKVDPIVPQPNIEFIVNNSDRRKIHANYVFKGNTIKEIQNFINSGNGVNSVMPNNPNGYTMLHRAVIQDNLEVVKYLLQNGADVNYLSFDKDCALSLVTSEEMFELLKTKNPKFDVLSVDRTTILHSYAQKGLINPVQYIVENKKNDINAKDRSGGTALIYAVQSNQYDVTKYLLKNGALQTYGWDAYPIHHAITDSNLEMVKLLVEHGANVNCKNSEGQTPLQMAKEYYGYKTEIIEFLIEKGGR